MSQQALAEPGLHLQGKDPRVDLARDRIEFGI